MITIAEKSPMNSRLDWLPTLPKGWRFARNGHIFSQRQQKGYPDLPILSVSLHSGVEVRDMDGEGRKQQMSDRSGYQRARKGDIAYNMMRMWQGAVGVAPVDGLVSPAYVIATPRTEINPAYFSYLYRTPAYQGESLKYSRGIVDDRNRLYWEDFKQMPTPLPPKTEQDAIVAYLDGKLEAIDRYLRVKEREIALLEERKRALIHRAVTRGFDPNPQLRPSCIPGVEELPSHWRSISIRRIAEFVTSGSRGWAQYSAPSGPLFLRICNLSRDSLDLRFDDVERVNPPAGAEGERTRVRSEDVLISITAYIGSVAVVPHGLEEAYVSQHIALVRLKSEAVLSKWVGYSILSQVGITQSNLMMYGGTKAGLSLDDVKSYTIPVPPSEEQRAIIDLIENEAADIATTITRARQQIERMQEYRTALIAEAVTGKIDVHTSD